MLKSVVIIGAARKCVGRDWFVAEKNMFGISRLYYVNSGSADIYFGSERLTLKAGRYYFIPQNRLFEPINETVESFDHSYIDFVVLSDMDIGSVIEIDKVTEPEVAAAMELPLICAMHRRDGHSPEQYYAIAEAYLFDMLEYMKLMLSIPKNDISGIEKALEHIHMNYKNKLHIGELASICHMSRNNFTERFREKMKMSPYQYIKAIRFTRAVEMLHSGATVKETALAIGYENQASFSLEFKKLYGVTPTQIEKGKNV